MIGYFYPLHTYLLRIEGQVLEAIRLSAVLGIPKNAENSMDVKIKSNKYIKPKKNKPKLE